MPEQPPRSLASAPSLASALYPSLSREAKAKEAEEAKARAEQQDRSKRLAADLRAMREKIKEERRR